MPEDLDKLKEEARAARKVMANRILVCACEWPLKAYRNGSGHAPDCPAHALWRQEVLRG